MWLSHTGPLAISLASCNSPPNSLSPTECSLNFRSRFASLTIRKGRRSVCVSSPTLLRRVSWRVTEECASYILYRQQIFRTLQQQLRKQLKHLTLQQKSFETVFGKLNFRKNYRKLLKSKVKQSDLISFLFHSRSSSVLTHARARILIDRRRLGTSSSLSLRENTNSHRFSLSLNFKISSQSDGPLLHYAHSADTPFARPPPLPSR